MKVMKVNPSMHLSINYPIYQSIYQSIHLSIYPSIYLCIYLSICLSIYPSTYVCNNNTIPFLYFFNRSLTRKPLIVAQILVAASILSAIGSPFRNNSFKLNTRSSIVASTLEIDGPPPPPDDAVDDKGRLMKPSGPICRYKIMWIIMSYEYDNDIDNHV